jgi:hypothetical protein
MPGSGKLEPHRARDRIARPGSFWGNVLTLINTYAASPQPRRSLARYLPHFAVKMLNS